MSRGQSPNADRTLAVIADCAECVIVHSGWQPREYRIEACEAHSALLQRECDGL